MKLVCMGDSLTEGWGIDQSKRWTTLLSEQTGLEIVNSGISGDTTAGMLARFKPMALDHDPSHVVIMGGTNDISHNLTADQVTSNIRAMTRHARHAGVATIIGFPTRAFASDEFLDGPMAKFFLEFVRRVDSFRSHLHKWAFADGQPIIDFAGDMTIDHFLEDGVHPNESGHALMAEHAYKVISSL